MNRAHITTSDLPGGASCRDYCSKDVNLQAYAGTGSCWCYTTDFDIPMYSTFEKYSGSKKPIHAWDVPEPEFDGYTPLDIHFLVVANYRDGQSYNINSVIYKYDVANKFESFQTIPTNGARDFEYYTDGVKHFLVVANHNIDSVIYEYVSNTFQQKETIATHGATDIESFFINDKHFIAVANRVKDQNYNTQSAVYDRSNTIDFIIPKTDSITSLVPFTNAGTIPQQLSLKTCTSIGCSTVSANSNTELPCSFGSIIKNNLCWVVSCLAGSIVVNGLSIDDQSCSVCEKGMYNPSLNQVSCLQCPKGRYNDDSNSSIELHNELEDCTKCVAGRYSISNDGQTSSDTCIACEAGLHASTNEGAQTSKDICISCEVGRFAAETGKIECPVCAKGKYSNTTGTVSCTDCKKGRYLKDEGVAFHVAESDCKICRKLIEFFSSVCIFIPNANLFYFIISFYT